MTENRRLTDFGGGDDADAGDDGDDGDDHDDPGDAGGEPATDSGDAGADAADSDACESGSPADESEPVGEPSVTYAWSAGSDGCERCGASVERRWRAGEGAADPDALVCSDCKEW